MGRPEVTVLQRQSGNGHIGGIGNVQKARTLLILVGALRIPLAAQPEGLPGAQTIAVNDAGAAERQAVNILRVDERGEIGAGLAFNSGDLQVVVGNVVAAQQNAASSHIQVYALRKGEGTAHPYTFRNDDHAATRGCAHVNYPLNLGGVDFSIRRHAVFIQWIGLAEEQGCTAVIPGIAISGWGGFAFVKPVADGRAVRKTVGTGCAFFRIHGEPP